MREQRTPAEKAMAWPTRVAALRREAKANGATLCADDECWCQWGPHWHFAPLDPETNEPQDAASTLQMGIVIRGHGNERPWMPDDDDTPWHRPS